MWQEEKALEVILCPSLKRLEASIVGMARSGWWRFSRYRALCHHPPPASWDPFRVPFLLLGVCKGSNTSRRSGQDAGERHSRDSQESGFGKLQSILPYSEGNRGLETSYWPVVSQQICHPHQLLDVNGFVIVGVDQVGRHRVLRNACFQIPFHPNSQPYLLIVLIGRVCQFKALCFDLSAASRSLLKCSF